MTHDSAATFLFADIAGFTALTEAHGDEEAVQLVEDFAAAVQAELPRVGANHGSTVERAGDYFGTTVNVAARVSALARGGELLVTGATAALAAGLDSVLYESRGRQTLRNIPEPVEIFSVVPLDEGAHQYVVDPVCKMAVDPDRAVGRLMLDGWLYTSAHSVARQPLRSIRSGTPPIAPSDKGPQPRPTLAVRRRTEDQRA